MTDDRTQEIRGEVKRGLAGYVRRAPLLVKILVVIFLLPFWATSELRQTSWPQPVKIASIAAVWLVTLVAVAGSAGEPDTVAQPPRARRGDT